MYSLWFRLNAVSCQYAVVVAVIAAFSAVSSIWLLQSPVIQLNSVETVWLTNPPRRHVNFYPGRDAVDGALLRATMTADLRPLFTWNTKQVFVWMSVEYAAGTRNSTAVFWDRIVKSKDEALIKLDKEVAEYVVVDKADGLRGAKGRVVVGYSVMPIAGVLRREDTAIALPFEFPSAYVF